MSHITDGMKPGDVKFVERRSVVCIQATKTRDDFKEADFTYTTLAEREMSLFGSDVAKAIKRVGA